MTDVDLAGERGDPIKSSAEWRATVQRLGRELAARMAKQGFSQKSLAIASHVNETFIRDILAGKSANPTATRLWSVCRVLDCTLDDLFYEGFHNDRLTLQERELLSLYRELPALARENAVKLFKVAANLAGGQEEGGGPEEV